jgi:hypothetical protein
MCRERFGIADFGSAEELNARFGGLRNGASSIYQTFATGDLHYDQMAAAPIERSEIYVGEIEGSASGADFAPESVGESESLQSVRKKGIDLMMGWLSLGEPCSGHGTKILNHCKCTKGWSGEACEKLYVSTLRFKSVAVISTVLPTLLVLITSIFAWRTILLDPETARSKPIVL